MAEEAMDIAVTDAQDIPAAQFIENVDAYMRGAGPAGEEAGGAPREVDAILREINARLMWYKEVEAKLQARFYQLSNKVPDIKKALEAVDLLVARRAAPEPLRVDFELADGIYAKAKVQGAASVFLWLGANCMLEYPLDEARSLLKSNLDLALGNIGANRRDMGSLREAMTTTEVNLARVYNWDVAKRRQVELDAAMAAK